MMTRHSWITAFVGRALRKGHVGDPDWIFDTADERYPESRDLDPEFVAGSTFGPENKPSYIDAPIDGSQIPANGLTAP